MKTKNPSKGELRDVAILMYCSDLLDYEGEEEFLSKEDTKTLLWVNSQLKKIVNLYSPFSKFLLKNKAKIYQEVHKIEGGVIHLTMLSLVTVHNTLESSEREFKPLSKPLQVLWKDIATSVILLRDKYYDLGNEEVCNSTEIFATKLLQRIQK